MTRRAHLAIALAFTACGCSVTGTHIEPVAPTAPVSFDSASDPALASALPVDAWWTTFADQTITTLVERALGGSPDVREATALVRLARARLREQEGANWPLGGANAGVERRRSQIGLDQAADVDLFDAGVDASWEVDVFGARRASIAAARADFARERSLRRLTLVSVAAEVVLTYADVRGTQARLAVARDNVANQESSAQLTQQLLTAGRGTQLDVDRAIALLESTRASIPPLVAAESSAIYRLGVLVGAGPQALAAELRVPQPLPPPPDVLGIGEPVTLLRRRPDVAAAESAVLAAAARAGVAAADLFPRLVLTGGVGFQAYSNSVGDLSESRSPVWPGSRYHAAIPRVEPHPPADPGRRCHCRNCSRRVRANGAPCARGGRARDHGLSAGAATLRPSRVGRSSCARRSRARSAAIPVRRRQLPDGSRCRARAPGCRRPAGAEPCGGHTAGGVNLQGARGRLVRSRAPDQCATLRRRCGAIAARSQSAAIVAQPSQDYGVSTFSARSSGSASRSRDWPAIRAQSDELLKVETQDFAAHLGPRPRTCATRARSS